MAGKANPAVKRNEKCLLFGEEVGKLFKAVRKAEQIHVDRDAPVTAVGDELADILIYLHAIANRFDVDWSRLSAAKKRSTRDDHRNRCPL